MYYKTPYTPTGPVPKPEVATPAPEEQTTTAPPDEQPAPQSAAINPSENIENAENLETNETPATEPPAAPPTLSAEEIAAMVAEAEQRGYLRGCNERIDTLMERPAMWQQPAQAAAPADDDTEIMILNHLRRSVWD